MAGDKNCVAHGVNNAGYDGYNGICKTLGSPFHKRMLLPWWEWLKIIIMSLTIAPIRLLLVIICLLITWFLSFLATSTSDRQKPMTGWRLWIKSLFCITARCVFFAGGFHWVTTRGHRCSVEEAPILVLAPHSSYLDALIIVYLGMCSVVGKEETSKIPMVGSLLLMTQPILVSREERHSRRKTIGEIQRRTQNVGCGWPQIAIFPEGTCTNRNCLIKFKGGAFIPGVPVQPVIIRWNNRVDTTVWTWDGPSTWTLLWLSLCQFHNRISLEYLPSYHPNAEEVTNPTFFARNVQMYIADHLGVPISDYSYEDSRILELAIRKRIPCASVILEMLRIPNLTNVERLQSMPIDRIPASVSLFELTRLLEMQKTPLIESIFHHYKYTEESTTMNYPRFLLDSVLLSHSTDLTSVISWAYNMYRRDSDFSYHSAEEIIAAIYPSVRDKDEGDILQAFFKEDDSISLQRFLEACEKMSQLKATNVYHDFHEHLTRLKQCY